MTNMATESGESQTAEPAEPLESAGPVENRRPLPRIIGQAASDAECSCAMAQEAAHNYGCGVTCLDL